MTITFTLGQVYAFIFMAVVSFALGWIGGKNSKNN